MATNGRKIQLDFAPIAQDMRIVFMNGIWNDFKSARESAFYLSNLAGGYNIHGVHNATHGKIADLRECGLGLQHRATDPVRQLHKMWDNFFENSSPNAKLLMICHSQGAIHTRNALLTYPPHLRERIFVLAVAPGAYIHKETCGGVIHYRTKKWYRDIVPRFDRRGAKRERDTIVGLDSHPDAAFFDHEFQSPTYQRHIRKHLLNYIINQGQSL